MDRLSMPPYLLELDAIRELVSFQVYCLHCLQ